MAKSWMLTCSPEGRVKVAVVVVICLALGGACQQGAKSTVSSADNPANADFQKDTVSDPQRFQPVFGDSVNRAFFWDQESTLHEASGEALRMDVLSVLYIEKASLPFVLRTSLMDIDVLELPLLLRIDAFDDEAGQSLELFSGALKVEKS